MTFWGQQRLSVYILLYFSMFTLWLQWPNSHNQQPDHNHHQRASAPETLSWLLAAHRRHHGSAPSYSTILGKVLSASLGLSVFICKVGLVTVQPHDVLVRIKRVICNSLKQCGPGTSYVLYEWINHRANQQLADGAALRNLVFLSFFFFFLMWTMSSKSVLNLLQHCLCSTFWLLGHAACGIPAPQPGIEHFIPLHWKAKSQPLDHHRSSRTWF